MKKTVNGKVFKVFIVCEISMSKTCAGDDDSAAQVSACASE